MIDYTFNNIVFHWKYTPKWHTQNVRGKIKHIYIEHGCYFLTVLFMKNYFKIIAIKFSLHISYHYFSKYYNFRGITYLPPYTLMTMCRREKREKKREEEECGEKEHKWKKSFGSWCITIFNAFIVTTLQWKISLKWTCKEWVRPKSPRRTRVPQ